MSERIVLAYAGGLAASVAAVWLAEQRGAEVVTVTLDVGQTDDLDEIRGRALACGAARAHVIDRRETFARMHVIPALASAARAGTAPPLDRLAHPLIAQALVEIAAIETADAVAHASAAASLDAELAALDPMVPILTPAREWGLDEAALRACARARGLPLADGPRHAHMLMRDPIDPAQAPDAEAHVTLTFERGVPVEVNGVPMTLEELVESLSLIGGQHGIGFGDAPPAPAAVLLQEAYRAAAAPDGTVRLSLCKGRLAVTGADSHAPLVTRP